MRKPSVIWIVLGVVGIVLLVFAGLAPLPGEKDDPNVLTEDRPTDKAARPPLPSGPPHAKPDAPPPPQPVK